MRNNKIENILHDVQQEFLNERDSLEEVFDTKLTSEQVDFAFRFLTGYINKVTEYLKENKNDLQDRVSELEYAKNAVKFCLENADGSVDMKGIDYWANRVHKLRIEIKEML